jgi:hypothetical protein
MARLASLLRRSSVAAVIASLFIRPSAGRADTAYFSFQGNFSVSSGASEDFNFTLPSIAGNNPLTLRTWSSSGGTNAAGQVIAANGFDSILQDLTSPGNVQVGLNDDASPSVPAGTHDSLLSPSGTNTSLLTNQAAGTYRLHLTNFGTTIGTNGNWATDIVNGATSANTIITPSTGSNSSLTSLVFGVSTGTANATVQISAGTLTLGSTGTLTANTGGIFSLSSTGILNANGNITVSGGTFIQSGGTFNWGAGKTLTINNTVINNNTTGGHFDITTGTFYALPASSLVSVSGSQSRFKVSNVNSTLLVEAGSGVLVTNSGLLQPDFLWIAANNVAPGSGFVSLTSSTLNATNTAVNFTNQVAANGQAGSLTLNTASTANITNTLLVADSGGVGTSGTVSVKSGSTLNTGNVFIGTNLGAATANGAITVTGLNSHWSQSQVAFSSMMVGVAPGTGTGAVNVVSSASYSNSNGPVTINKTGTFKLGTGGTGGSVFVGGTFTVNGGSLIVDSTGTFTLGNNPLIIQNGGTASFASVLSSPGIIPAPNFDVTVDGIGSNLTLSSAAIENSFGFNGQTNTIAFTNGSTGTLSGTIGLADASAAANSTGIFNVQSGAAVSGSATGVSLLIGTGSISGQFGALNVDGLGSSFNQNAASSVTLSIGNSSGGSGGVNVTNLGTFTSGTGVTNVFNQGSITVSHATYNANGPINSGGNIEVDTGGLLNSVSNVSNNAKINIFNSIFNANSLTLSGNSALFASNSTTTIGASGIFGGSSGTFPTATFAGGTFTSSGTISLLTGTIAFQSGAHASVPGGIATGQGGIDSSEVSTIMVTDPGTTLTTPVFTLSDYTGTGVLTVTNGGSFTQGATSINTGILAQIGSGGFGSVYNGPSLLAVINIANGGNVAYGSLPSLGTINFSSGSFGFLGDLPIGFAANAPFGSALFLGSNQSLALSGTTTINSGASLTLNGGSFSTGSLVNNGTMNFLSGVLAFNGAGGLTVGSGGALGANVNLTAGKTVAVVNAVTTVVPTGIVFLNGGSLIASSLTNNGEIQILDPTSQLSGGTITNNKLIDGNGHVSNNLTNNALGEIRASNMQRLTFSGATNTNSGKINMVNGGTIEFTNALTNNAAGVITGRGALITGGLINNGQLQLSAGFTDVYGTLTTAAGSKVIVSGGSTSTFYNDVTASSGSEFRVSTASTAVFFGNVHGTSFFTGSGVKDFEGPSASSLGDVDTLGSTIVNLQAVVAANHFNETSLTVDGLVNITPKASGGGTSNLQSLVVDPGGTLDLNDNSTIVTYPGASPAAMIRSYLVSGFNGGNWNGNGIDSSAAHNDPTFRTALGYLDNGTNVTVKYTYYGDSNLDGSVTVADFQRYLDGLAAGGSTWGQGDFTYDGRVDIGNDFNLFLVGYLKQGGALGDLAPIVGGDTALSTAQKAQLLAFVPEPSMLMVIVPLLVCHRRRR